MLSPASYNGRAGMIVCCPTTTRIKGYPFEVALAGTPPSVVLADQARSQDWRARQATRKGRVSARELAEVRAKLITLIAGPATPDWPTPPASFPRTRRCPC